MSLAGLLPEGARIVAQRNPRMAATGFKQGGRPMTIPEVVARWRAARASCGAPPPPRRPWGSLAFSEIVLARYREVG